MMTLPDKTVMSRKKGAENIIMINLPADRFRNHIPSHYDPAVDHRSRYRVALLAQSCESYSFDNNETGPACEFHFWFWVASSDDCTPVKGADIMLPSMNWLTLTSATNQVTIRKYLRSFGFSPINLEKIELQKHGGSLDFLDGGRIEWSIVRTGKEPSSMGVNHTLFTKADGPGATGHRVTALLTDAVIEQPGKIYISKQRPWNRFFWMVKGSRWPSTRCPGSKRMSFGNSNKNKKMGKSPGIGAGFIISK